ncbi:hypothetical protein P8452_54558 [Trifolium repens]|nr:hypothetical protein P8452_54558 [Trifolium repens]
MNTLQRSSCSFRRQGSSGRIWQDSIFMEPKGNGNPSPMKSQLKEENVPQIESNIVVGRRMYENEIVPHSQPSTKNQNKIHQKAMFKMATKEKIRREKKCENSNIYIHLEKSSINSQRNKRDDAMLCRGIK